MTTQTLSDTEEKTLKLFDILSDSECKNKRSVINFILSNFIVKEEIEDIIEPPSFDIRKELEKISPYEFINIDHFNWTPYLNIEAIAKWIEEHKHNF